MSDIKLFRTNGETVTQLEGQSVALDKSLQELIEQHLDIFLGIRFLATACSTDKPQGVRIDTLGIDKNGCPCVIQYKRSNNENVIHLALLYLDWLVAHRSYFEQMVQKTLGAEAAESIQWSSPRVLCIADDFTQGDLDLSRKFKRNIHLLRCLRFGEDLLQITSVLSPPATTSETVVSADLGIQHVEQALLEKQINQRSDSVLIFILWVLVIGAAFVTSQIFFAYNP